MAYSTACLRILLALAIVLPLIQAQPATDPAAVYNVTVSPWVNHRHYAPLSLPVGSQLNFAWNGNHGVYLIPTDQCPTTFPPGPNELYAPPGPASVNNVLSMNLTTPGIFYFACQVGDHCIEDGQKLVVSVTNSTPGALTGLGMVTASTG